ncbi:MAG: hypothetical protein U1E45_22875 [Geminicoccaceae bacterium]
MRVADALDSATDSAIKLQRARSYKVDLVAERIDRCACSALLVEGASEVHEMDVAQACREQGMVSGHELRFRPRPSIGVGRQDRQPAHRFASPHCERRTPSDACIEENWCLCCERGNDAARYLVLRRNASATITSSRPRAQQFALHRVAHQAGVVFPVEASDLGGLLDGTAVVLAQLPDQLHTMEAAGRSRGKCRWSSRLGSFSTSWKRRSASRRPHGSWSARKKPAIA